MTIFLAASAANVSGWQTFLIAMCGTFAGLLLLVVLCLVFGFIDIRRAKERSSRRERPFPPVSEDELVAVKLHFHPGAWERIWTAAAFNGWTRTEVINWGAVLMEAIMRMEPGTTLTFTDPSGVEHKILIRK